MHENTGGKRRACQLYKWHKKNILVGMLILAKDNPNGSA